MFDRVVSALESGAFYIAVTMALVWMWAVIATKQGSRSQLLTDMEPVFFWVEIQTINIKFLSYNRSAALFIVFAGLGLLLWFLLAFMTFLLHSLSPELLNFLLTM